MLSFVFLVAYLLMLFFPGMPKCSSSFFSKWKCPICIVSMSYLLIPARVRTLFVFFSFHCPLNILLINHIKLHTVSSS